MSRIGVFVCHCGINIAGIVDVERVAEEIGRHPEVAYATTYSYMCSNPGQHVVRGAIAEHDLDGVVVAACSPLMHDKTFRRAASAAGLNPYRCEMANIREQCSWVHQHEPGRATEKAIEIVRTVVEKVRLDEELEPFHLPLTKRALVIGGGIAGIQAALDIASAGFPVVLVEREAHLGGKMAHLSGTYLNFTAAPDLLERKIAQVLNHPHIEVLTGAQVVGVEGYVGNFEVTVGRSGNWEADQSTNLPTYQSTDVGAIVVATGWDPYPLERLPEYGGGEIPDVVDGLTFEEMLREYSPGQEIRNPQLVLSPVEVSAIRNSAGGGLRRPSDGRTPREVVFVQCAGSRDPERGVPYCSKVCCMYVAKQAMMFRERVPEGQAYVFYIDIRSAGKGYDEYVQRAMEEHDILYLRGKVSKIFARDGKTIVWGADTLSGQPVEVAADLVVLATPMTPSRQAFKLAQTLRIGIDQNGFFSEAHPKLRPVESLTAGVFLAGAAQGPKDIPETVSQASGAAAKVLKLFSQDEMTQEPMVAYVVEQLCSGCGVCVEACPYEARQVDPIWGIAMVNAALCQNCGACVVACLNKASRIHNWTPEQILAMADVVSW
ncbi:MAG: CoB--CoM heterodisulfide reductase iron-sulfur subunit A family protein [Anaerolineae bacterium]|nr:CoB--CoM heterodisulfide reductase iron-sulfur subunit A family protein [Anaerolineae bacterium]